MREIGLQIKMRIKGVNIINNNIEKSLLNIIFWSFGVLALWYVFVLGNTVSDIMQRRALLAETRTLSGEVADLELVYLSMSNNVDLPLSYSLGFKETKPKFVTRKPLGALDSVKVAKNEI